MAKLKNFLLRMYMKTTANIIKKSIIWREFLVLITILFLSLTLRLAFISVFPTIPVSDFHVIVSFAKVFAEDFFARGHPGWGSINPGLPFFLSFLLRIIPAQAELVARWTTALLTGSLPLIPFLVWRGVFPLPARSISALLLAVWPAQIIFSGVIAQDNWVLFPTIFLVSLAVRFRGCAICAGRLYPPGNACRAIASILDLSLLAPEDIFMAKHNSRGQFTTFVFPINDWSTRPCHWTIWTNNITL
jgi:hypothetical protein